MIKYIGSKRKLVPQIVETVTRLPRVASVLDMFSGTSRVGHALKRAGYRVTSNDHTACAYTLARCYVEADRASVVDEVEARIDELMSLPPRPGYFTETFCVASRYLRPENGARVDAMRERIAEWTLDPVVEAVLLVSLMEAADRVDSTCGLQMAFLKSWSPRSINPLTLRVPEMLDGEGRALCLDAFAAAKAGHWDVAYLDPPYNQHKYMNNYHVWESLVRWDKPAVYGRACKRLDCREYQSAFNSKRRIKDALRTLFAETNADHLLVSFNNEGYVAREEMRELLSEQGEVAIATFDHERYVGARIGIYNPAGAKVGRISHVKNCEHLFVVSRSRANCVRSPRPALARSGVAEGALAGRGEARPPHRGSP